MLRRFLVVLIRRLFTAVPILFVVSILLFGILRLLPVDPAAMSMAPTATLDEIAEKRRAMGLDRPLPEQYLIWLDQMLHGDFGLSTHFLVGPLDRWLPPPCRRHSNSPFWR
jgi:ABC-type dipeptide/oligopeptide/nickel transport system permease component